MFCPKCGNADQAPETYCRQCGVFLPDLSKPIKRQHPPEEHIKVNSVLSLMTVIVSFTLAILLWSLMGFRQDTHPLVYVTASLLTAIGAWHIQTFIRMRMLRKQWKRRNSGTEVETGETSRASRTRNYGKQLKRRNRRTDVEASNDFRSVSTAGLLDESDFENIVPPSITDNTTRHLVETRGKSS